MMKSGKLFTREALLAFMMIMGVWACAGKPFDPPRTDEIPKGPGVFTKGNDGAVLYDSNKEPQPAVSVPQTPATASNHRKQPAPTSEYEEYEDYQKWLLWKKTAAGTPEYEEFQQWREWWKYQEWKNPK